MQTLLIDNYDSYTFNLYQLIAAINGTDPIVIRNDQLSWDDLKQLEAEGRFDNVVISPGPGHPSNPQDFGICAQVIAAIDKPILGVCLGHQGIAQVWGGTVRQAPEIRHGIISAIYHQHSDLFHEIPNPFGAVRYHSLIVERTLLPDCLEITAWTKEGLIMGLRHRHKPIFGVQFHPESVCTDYGYLLLQNFKTITVTQGSKQPLPIPSPSPQKIETIRSARQSTRANYNTFPQNSQFQLFTRKLDFLPNPEQVFVHLYGDSPYSFWLDSSQSTPGLSRFSFMGNDQGRQSLRLRYHCPSQSLEVVQNQEITHHQISIFDYLQRELDRRFQSSATLPFDFNCGFVGYFGYELKLECGAVFAHAARLPDAAFLLATQMLAFDHQAQTTYLLYLGKPQEKDCAQTWFNQMETHLATLPPLSSASPLAVPSVIPSVSPSVSPSVELSLAPPIVVPPVTRNRCQEPLQFRLRRSRQIYLQNIEQCLREIHKGESYEICLTNQIFTETSIDPLGFYRHLRQQNPAPYSAFLRFGDFAIVCSSPERFLKVDRNRWVETKPIKGTLPRGNTPQADQHIRQQLGYREKERAENLMVLDLLRNDLGRVCEVGTVHVPRLMQVETYATLHQLVSTVRGRLRQDLTITDCIRAAFPGGSMTGAPKRRTMEILDRLEGEARGIYSGAIGFLGLNGTADLNIAIRTAIVTPRETSIGVGGGIIALSDPELEFDETLLKAKALMEAIVQTLYGYGEVSPDLYKL